MIHFFEEQRSIYLETENTSYVMYILENGTLVHSYYGEKIPQEEISYSHIFHGINCSAYMKNGEEILSPEMVRYEYPTFGRGDFRVPAIKVEGRDGSCVNELVYVSHKIMRGKPKFQGLPQLDVNVENLETLEILLRDEISGFEVWLYYSVFFGEDVIARHSVIRNIGESSIWIHHAASASIDFPVSDYEMITLEGSWARERSVERCGLHHGSTIIDSRRGASSHQTNPFAAFARKDTNEYQGEVYGAALIYSGDFRILAEKDHLDALRVQLGINPETFRWKLKTKEEFVTPEVLLTYSSRGMNRMSQSFHSVCRKHLGNSAKKSCSHPIVVNSWEAMYFDFDESKMIDFIESCVGLGIDVVVIDDGWFGNRADDTSSLGDWEVNIKKFPNGLMGVSNACMKNGMGLGIWLEPEMISENSNLYRMHPDWCIHTLERECIEVRNQLVLDMSRKEVVDYIYGKISELLNAYPITYVKWDMNRNITDNFTLVHDACGWGELAHRNILGVYDLMNRLTSNYPQVFFEGCASGGGRFDFGILYYMPQIWTSDNTDAIERMKIQYGTSFAYPASSMSAHVSDCPNHQTGRTTPLKTRAEVAQMCNFGYEFDIRNLDKEMREEIKKQIKKHRELETLVENGKFYRLRSPFETNFCAWQLVSEDQNKSYVMFGFLTVTGQPKIQYLKLQGLNEYKKYTIVQLGITVSGQILMKVGIPICQPVYDYGTETFDIISEL